jgi:DNA-binding CsgD family transcriptional regulator
MRLGAAAHFYGTGRWDDALAEIEAALDESDRLPTMNQMWRYGITALIAARRDNPIDADHERAMDQLIADTVPGSIAGTEFPLMARAVLAERDGSQEQALAILRDWFTSTTYFASRATWLPQLVRLALACGDRELATDAVKAMVNDGDVDSTSIAPPHRAIALQCHGQLDADPALLLAAAATYRDCGRPLAEGHALEEAAVVLAGRGERAAARAAYAEATDIYTQLGATWDLRRADTRLRPLGLRRQRAPRRRATTGWDALTPTELDVAHLVAQGLPNPDIATRLYSSRRTIEVHVSHILTKLQLRSRVDIARHVAEAGRRR